ncbi:MAG: hypothetical protein J7K83_03545 [Candidatus Aenigmarchaeota archaeon]|nr:hypothetical protein [Candidatus Aenigmarchaeota archaeon]
MSIAFLSLGLLDIVSGILLYLAEFSPGIEKVADFLALALILKGLWSLFAYFAYHE